MNSCHWWFAKFTNVFFCQKFALYSSHINYVVILSYFCESHCHESKYIEIFGPLICWNIWTPVTKIYDIFGPLWNILSPWINFTFNILSKGRIIYFTWNIWSSNSKSTIDTFLSLYNTVIRPHLEYGNMIWRSFMY